MKKLFLPLFLIIMVSLMVFGCKKDKDDQQPNNTEQELRTTVYSLTVSGDFEGEYETSEVNAVGGTGAIVGAFDSDLNDFELAVVFSGLPNNGTSSLHLYTEMSALAPGNYTLGDVDIGTSQFTFMDDSTNVSYTVDSGTLNITNVELVQIYFPGVVSGHYINGTFSLIMSNAENETATAQGQFVNSWIISN